MRHAIIVTVVLLTACTAPQKNSATPDLNRSITPTRLAETHASPPPSVPPWTIYREFNFDSTMVDISISDIPKLREIVAHLEGNPSLDIGIDGSSGSEVVGPADRNLSNRRAASVRRALMETGAGVASYKIIMGPFPTVHSGHIGRIQVWVGPRISSPSEVL